MRKIVYIALETESLSPAVLDVCSAHSALVEPISAQEVLLDLSRFNRISEVINLLVDALVELIPGRFQVGLAASPLLARLAVQRRSWAGAAASSCRRFKIRNINIIQIIPGQAARFISTLTLQDFSPLSAQECRLLSRLGYSTVGELRDLGPARLKPILKRDITALWQNICGRDSRPVRGLYPPETLGYSLAWEDGRTDRGQLLLGLQGAAEELGSLLRQRHKGCQQVQLQLETADGPGLSLARQLSGACQDSARLRIILEGLLPALLDRPVTGLRICLGDLQALEMRSPDLFTLRSLYQAEAKQQQRAALLEQLDQRFPGRVELGMKVERREQVLRFWDPWRFAAEVG